jgi:hypothetical protein
LSKVTSRVKKLKKIIMNQIRRNKDNEAFMLEPFIVEILKKLRSSNFITVFFKKLLFKNYSDINCKKCFGTIKN